jgi:hypothetical protein
MIVPPVMSIARDYFSHGKLPLSRKVSINEFSVACLNGRDGIIIVFHWQNFDRMVDKYGLEKIRTIGDNYMVASGVPAPREDHAQAMAYFALEMLHGLEEIPARHGNR